MIPPVGFYIRESIKWVVTAVAVIYAIHLTNSSGPIWFFLIPGIFSNLWKPDKDETKDIEQVQ